MLYLDGRTAGITTVGINTTNQTIKFDANNNVMVTGIITATEFHGTLAVGTSVTYGDNEKAYFGTGLDMSLYHDATNSYLKNNTNNFNINTTGSFVVASNAGSNVGLFPTKVISVPCRVVTIGILMPHSASICLVKYATYACGIA